jgi:hypothetical protein
MAAGYSSGMRRMRVHIFNPSAGTDGDYGRNSGGRTYAYATTVWAAKDFSRGVKAMREGAVDAYDTIMLRMLWNSVVCRQSLILVGDVTYQITSFNADFHDNKIQITAVEAPGKDMRQFMPTDTNDNAGGDDNDNNNSLTT